MLAMRVRRGRGMLAMRVRRVGGHAGHEGENAGAGKQGQASRDRQRHAMADHGRQAGRGMHSGHVYDLPDCCCM